MFAAFLRAQAFLEDLCFAVLINEDFDMGVNRHSSSSFQRRMQRWTFRDDVCGKKRNGKEDKDSIKKVMGELCIGKIVENAPSEV